MPLLGPWPWPARGQGLGPGLLDTARRTGLLASPLDADLVSVRAVLRTAGASVVDRSWPPAAPWLLEGSRSNTICGLGIDFGGLPASAARFRSVVTLVVAGLTAESALPERRLGAVGLALSSSLESVLVKSRLLELDRLGATDLPPSSSFDGSVFPASRVLEADRLGAAVLTLSSSFVELDESALLNSLLLEPDRMGAASFGAASVLASSLLGGTALLPPSSSPGVLDESVLPKSRLLEPDRLGAMPAMPAAPLPPSSSLGGAQRGDGFRAAGPAGSLVGEAFLSGSDDSLDLEADLAGAGSVLAAPASSQPLLLAVGLGGTLGSALSSATFVSLVLEDDRDGDMSESGVGAGSELTLRSPAASSSFGTRVLTGGLLSLGMPDLEFDLRTNVRSRSFSGDAFFSLDRREEYEGDFEMAVSLADSLARTRVREDDLEMVPLFKVGFESSLLRTEERE